MKKYSIVSNLMYLFRYFKKTQVAILWMVLITVIVDCVSALIGIYIPKIALDLVISQAPIHKVAIVFSIITIILIIVYGAQYFKDYNYAQYNNKRQFLVSELFLKTLSCEYKYIEDGDSRTNYYNTVESLAWGDDSLLNRAIQVTTSFLINVTCFVLYSTVITYLNPYMLIFMIILSLLNYSAMRKEHRLYENTKEESTILNRKYHYIKAESGNVKAAKDIRIFGMHQWLFTLRDRVLDALEMLDKVLKRQAFKREVAGFLVEFLTNSIAYVYLIYQVVEGNVSVAEFVLYFGAIMGFSNFIIGTLDTFNGLKYVSIDTNYVRAHLKLPDENLEDGEKYIKNLTYPVEIKFEHIDFRYGESADWILKDFSFTIHSGEKVAIVGVNGTGKTTLVKLMCGMLEPENGKIYINNIDITKFPKKELYQLFATVFQEPAIFPFTVGENLAFKTMDCVDEKRAWAALDLAGIGKVFRKKNIALNSYMSKELFEDGVVLSGGEQQRFLLARALYKNAPILVLDEPTAALDPIAESEVYTKYASLSEGKTSIFISHRLASTVFSDRILMIQNGQVIESGTHEELMLAKGRYKKMFEVQSSYYKEEDVYEK